MTAFGDHATQGKPLPNFYQFDEPTSAILQHLRWKVPNNDEHQMTLDYDSLLLGIKKWPEQTTTSPLG